MQRSRTYNDVKRRANDHQSSNHREESRKGVEHYPLEHSREDDLAIEGQCTPASRFALKSHGE